MKDVAAQWEGENTCTSRTYHSHGIREHEHKRICLFVLLHQCTVSHIRQLVKSTILVNKPCVGLLIESWHWRRNVLPCMHGICMPAHRWSLSLIVLLCHALRLLGPTTRPSSVLWFCRISSRTVGAWLGVGLTGLPDAGRTAAPGIS